MDSAPAPKKAAVLHAPPPAVTVAVGMLPWAAAFAGSYVLHSAIASFVFYHTLCIVSASIFRLRFGPRDGRPFHHRHWLLLAVLCLLVCFSTYAATGLLGWLAHPKLVLQGLHNQHIPLNKRSYILLFAYFAVVNPIVEEYFWRGTIYASLRRRHWKVSACSNIDALLFGSWHWLIIRLFFPPVIALLVTVGIVIAGELFCRFYERTRSLPALCLLHGLGADVPVLVLLWFAVLSKTG